jgi:hypothetical protein
LPVAGHLSDWLGPIVSPEQLARFEISYQTGKTEYLEFSPGDEGPLTPAILPEDLSSYDLVHVDPMFDAERQLAFIQACRQRGAKRISAGTGLFIAAGQARLVREVIEQTDIFFMNDQEASLVFGSLESAVTKPGKILYVTRGPDGAWIILGDYGTMIPAASTHEVDPTGAGDAFCGAVLANLLQKKHPIMAARRGAALAAEVIGQVGPAALLSEEPPPEAPLDPRVRVNVGQVGKVAEMISTLSEVSPYSFISPELPPAGHPKALEYFFAATLQQLGFWTIQDGRYGRPMVARIGGVELKGSDYLWAAYNRKLGQDAEFCSPERQANLSREEMLAVFKADDGEDPMPAMDLHLEQARHYGRDMLALKLTPETLLERALTSSHPLQTFLDLLDQIGGFKEDPLRKRSALLAMILQYRPEKFLRPAEDEEIPPIIDYHLMRSCLRVGLIDVVDEGLKNKLSDRQIISPAEEWAVRYPAYLAIDQVITLSGKSTNAVDQFFFGMRKRCPEMTEPECSLCSLDPVCAKRKGLFQPVLRTSFY